MKRNEERNVVLDEVKTDLEKFINERIEENKDIFTNKELKIIESNDLLAKKIYILGIADSIF